MLHIQQKSVAEQFIEDFREIVAYHERFSIEKAGSLGKQGKTVYVSITHTRTTNSKVELSEANELETDRRLIEDALLLIYSFKMPGITYYSPKKITFVTYFKSIKTRSLANKETLNYFIIKLKKMAFIRDFEVIEIKPIKNILKTTFRFKPAKNLLDSDKNYSTYDKYYPTSYLEDVKKFPKAYLREKAESFKYTFPLLNENFAYKKLKIKEVYTSEDVTLTYLFKVKQKRYDIFEFGICKESRHLLVKYLKMVYQAESLLAPYLYHDKNNVFFKLYTTKKSYKSARIEEKNQRNLRFLYEGIIHNNTYLSNSEYIFTGKDYEEKNFPKRFLWIPNLNQLKDLASSSLYFGNVNKKYQEWRVKNKVSIKVEEINWLAYFMDLKYDKVWDNHKERWIKKPLPVLSFKINKFLTVKLNKEKIEIYVKGKLFRTCMYLLFNIPKEEIPDYEGIDSIDEIKAYYSTSHENDNKNEISPEVEFRAHCSNLQAWAENNYDTRILEMRLAFPLLKRLTKLRDPIAKKVFKEEIALRLETNFFPVVQYLINESYLSFFEPHELETISYNVDFSLWDQTSINRFFGIWWSLEKDEEKKEKIAVRCKEYQ